MLLDQLPIATFLAFEGFWLSLVYEHIIKGGRRANIIVELITQDAHSVYLASSS